MDHINHIIRDDTNQEDTGLCGTVVAPDYVYNPESPVCQPCVTAMMQDFNEQLRVFRLAVQTLGNDAERDMGSRLADIERLVEEAEEEGHDAVDLTMLDLILRRSGPARPS